MLEFLSLRIMIGTKKPGILFPVKSTQRRERIHNSLGMTVVVALAWFALVPCLALAQETATAPGDSSNIRDMMTRPPARHSADWVDVVEFPLKVVGWPIDFLLLRFPAWLAGRITAPRPPGFVIRSYRASVDWGLKPAVKMNIGPRSGVAVEQQLTRFHPIYVHAAVSQRLSQRHRLGVRLDGETAWFLTEVKWQRESQRPFHGIGSHSPEDDRPYYRRDFWDATARTGYTFFQDLTVSLGVGYEHNEIGDPIMESESIFDLFPVNSLFGAEGPKDYARFELGGTLDLSRWEDFQQKGITLGVEGRLFHGLGETDSDFRLYDGFFHTYLPLNPQQLLALRAVSSVASDGGGGGVPFYHLPTLGGTRSALGFPTNRFVDNVMASLMSEYRFEVWRELHSRMRAETFLFFHYGAVGDALGQIEAGDWHSSYGLGLRLSYPTALIGLGYLGFSDEGMTGGIRTSWRF